MSASIADEGLDVNLTPLLDLVLQLIMFFMITVNFVRVDQFDESINLPMASQAVPLDNTAEDWVFLNMDSQGRPAGALKNVALNTPEKLKAFLEREKESLERAAKARGKTGEIKITIVLRADKDTQNDEVWSFLASCQRAGFKHWQWRVMTVK